MSRSTSSYKSSNRERPSSRKKGKSSHRKSSPQDYRPVPVSGIKKVVSRIWNVLFYVITIGILIGAILFKVDNSPTKSFYGYHFMTVKTNSMAGKKDTSFKDGFPAGSFIVVKKEDPNTLKVGDIITFFPVAGNTSAYLTHRIVEVDTPISGEGDEQTIGITTQGDSNDGPDFPIEKSQVVGKVIWSVKGVGDIVDFIRTKYLIVGLLVVVLFGFTMALKYYMSIPTLEPTSKRRRR